MSENGTLVSVASQLKSLAGQGFRKTVGKLASRMLPTEVRGPEPEYAPSLSGRHVGNCRVFPRREDMLTLVPKGSICAEVGTETGYFSAEILTKTTPKLLHLLDLNLSAIRYDLYPLREAIDRGQVVLHEGDSSTLLSTFPDLHFDWLYVDGDHSYAGVMRDIAQVSRVVKHDGIIVFNDYTQYSPIERAPYGVMKAVNELCLKGAFELIGLALHGMGYHDVAVRRIQ